MQTPQASKASVFTKEARARSRESRLLRTESQEIRKQPSHRLALRWENETTHRDPESAREAIAPCDEVHGQSCCPEAEFGHLRVRRRRPNPPGRPRSPKASEYLPRHRFEWI